MEMVQEMFHGYLAQAMKRGEIEPVIDLPSLLPSLMAIAHGMALNDLPSLGVPLEKLEIIIRTTVEGLLRPTGKSKTA